MRIGEGETVPRRFVERVVVLENARLTAGVGLLVLQAPRIAASVGAGQFVHLRIATGTDLLLRRPFSVHRVTGEHVQLLYQVLGRGTRALSLKRRDDVMDAVGPLGTGFRVPDGAARALIAAGGLGVAPMGMLAEELAGRGVATTVALGAPTARRLVARDLLGSLARRVEVATDDGSEGREGSVTALTEDLLASDPPDVVYSCGPEAMSREVCRQAAEAGVACQVSLERLMACGVGACLSCVVGTTAGLVRACVEGPVFDAGILRWDESETPPRH